MAYFKRLQVPAIHTVSTTTCYLVHNGYARGMRHSLLLTFRFLGFLSLCSFLSEVRAETSNRPPNVVIVFTDDQGWGDLSCYGSQEIPTPHIDRLAAEGMRFTDFYVSQPVCSASRASLLTGCYANRVGIQGALGPNARVGLDPTEHTLAEVVKPLGYATACYGKWHLGHHPRFLPTNQGFDEYFGIPYSNDMWPGHPGRPKNYPQLAWYEDKRKSEPIVDLDDQQQITRRLTKKAVNFIHRCGERPFLLYIPHSMPHVPLGVGPQFRQSTMYGPYGDVIREIDWSVGELRKALEQEGVLNDTIVIYSSDNGPWLNYGDHAGTTGGLREGKGTTFEGGVRVPFIIRYPHLVPAGTVCAEPAMTIDVLPTLVELTGGQAPARKIDGRSIAALLRGDRRRDQPSRSAVLLVPRPTAGSDANGQVEAALRHKYRSLQGRTPGNNGRPVRYAYDIPISTSLFDLASDPTERIDLANDRPQLVSRMTEMANRMRDELGDTLSGRAGSENRAPGQEALSDDGG